MNAGNQDHSAAAGPSLVVGGDALIGCELAKRLTANGQHVITTTRRDSSGSPTRLRLDLVTDGATWHPPEPVSVAYWCAAVTSLDECQASPLQSWVVNVTSTESILDRLISRSAFVVFLSSNLVFDGTVPFCPADAQHSPTTEYGRQKARVERFLSRHASSAAVVRFAKVMPESFGLIREWKRSLLRGETITAVSDVAIAPVSVSFAVDVLCRIGERRGPGVWQLSARDHISYYEIAVRLAENLGVPPDLVKSAAAAETQNWLVSPPEHTTLEAGRVVEELGVRIPSAWEAIDRALQQSGNSSQQP